MKKEKRLFILFQDNIPELQEGFIINITDVHLITSSSGCQPSVKRLGFEIAEITIEENDDARGIFIFNVTKVSKSERKTCKVAFEQYSLIPQMTSKSVLIGSIMLKIKWPDTRQTIVS